MISLSVEILLLASTEERIFGTARFFTAPHRERQKKSKYLANLIFFIPKRGVCRRCGRKDIALLKSKK